MSKKLVYYGNYTLRQPADEVKKITQATLTLIDDMFNIMYHEKGIGLAAPQIDISRRIIVVDIQSSNGPAMALINPEIVSASGDSEPYEEGCLSLPGIMGQVFRPGRVTVKGITPAEKEIVVEAKGLLARVLQHEIDHLNGVLFIDHLEDYLKKELTAELKKIKKLNKAS